MRYREIREADQPQTSVDRVKDSAKRQKRTAERAVKQAEIGDLHRRIQDKQKALLNVGKPH